MGNVGFRAAYEKRKAIDNLPGGFDWPTTPEMEISFKLSTGVSYRLAPASAGTGCSMGDGPCGSGASWRKRP